MIDIRNLHFSYSNGSVGFSIDSLECSIPSKGISCIMGPNGCGKSTLLNLMLKDLIPEQGSILLDDVSIYDYRSQKKHALNWGLLPQEGRTLPDMEVVEFIRLASYARTSFFDDFSELGIETALKMSSSGEFRNRKLGELSGGEIQRVMLARLLFQDPRIFLLDEPGNHLDPRRQQELFVQLREIAKEKAVIMVLHDINGAARFADHIVFLKNGKLVAAGRKDDILTSDVLEQVYDIEYEKINHKQGTFYYPVSTGVNREISQNL